MCRSNLALDWRFFSIVTGIALGVFTVTPPVLAGDAAASSPAAQAAVQKLAALPPVPPPSGARIAVDHSGRREQGKASIYSHSLDGRTMADGRPYDPHAAAAASRSLPLGATARVTNLQTGKSTDVKIEDRGPFVKGRVVDLTPHAAHQIGLTPKQGLAPVVVAPIAVPQPDGQIKPGAGAAPPPEEQASDR